MATSSINLPVNMTELRLIGTAAHNMALLCEDAPELAESYKALYEKARKAHNENYKNADKDDLARCRRYEKIAQEKGVILVVQDVVQDSGYRALVCRRESDNENNKTED